MACAFCVQIVRRFQRLWKQHAPLVGQDRISIDYTVLATVPAILSVPWSAAQKSVAL